MAKIVLGLGTSHTPMLLASDETLERFVETDQKIKHRDKEGGRSPMATCWKRPIRSSPTWWRRSIWSPARTSRAPRSRGCARRSPTPKLDALIVMGDDQDESYKEDCRPAFAIYYGDTIRNSNEQHENYRARYPGMVRARTGKVSSRITGRATTRSIPASPCISSRR